MGFSISRQHLSDGKPSLSGEGGEGKQGWRFGSSFLLPPLSNKTLSLHAVLST